MRSIELILDDSTDSIIRADWARLAEAGVPSLAGHTSPSNSPHITLAAGPELNVAEGSAGLWQGLPLDIGFSGIQIFPAGPDRYVLARSLVVTDALLDLHHALHGLTTGAVALTLPGSWTPHITLARRVPGYQLGTALPLLDLRLSGQCTGARRWDSATKTITRLGPFSPAISRLREME